jgi:hypothetical protein
MMRFGIGVRSRFLDEVAVGGAGISTDPEGSQRGLRSRYVAVAARLPPGLRWIEVDFVDMLDYKDALMSA